MITFFDQDSENFDSNKIDSFRRFNFHQEKEWRSVSFNEPPVAIPTNESVKEACQQITATLFPSNWRFEGFDFLLCLHNKGHFLMCASKHGISTV